MHCKRFILVTCYTGTISAIGSFDTMGEAHDAMVRDFKASGDFTDDDINKLLDHQESDDFEEFAEERALLENKAWAECVGPENMLCQWQIIDTNEIPG